ncbi:hypothetical protein [Polyangium mundeleinium]|uniref:Secreted protein n=1 Tax=Polyangium mundeleinium TaxID=2995306 RepID=A0ABT5EYG7_9BACT|nr:hypothetical protein [Polyangium mundeleinium]MDC0746439.1 hypothetical protein [Polyangium mundeleinium]
MSACSWVAKSFVPRAMSCMLFAWSSAMRRRLPAWATSSFEKATSRRRSVASAEA